VSARPIIFTGPSLPPEAAADELDAVILPPAAQGDVYRAARGRPPAIGIIDGYFERVPAVWHKEILWAMAEGIHVYGAASMGALRAAELAPFGMEGVGRVFEAYRDGRLEADDEVAVIHGPPELGYRPLCEPLVNIRFTLERAEAEGVVTGATRGRLESALQALHYRERSWAAVLQAAPEREAARLGAWLPGGRIDQKRLDALAMLRLMQQRLADGIEPKRVAFSFEHTQLWTEATRRAERPDEVGPEGEPDAALAALAAEAGGAEAGRADPVAQGAARMLMLDDARRRGAAVDAPGLREQIRAFRRRHGLLEPEQLAAWLAENGIDETAFVRLMADEALLAWWRARFAPAALAALPDILRAEGRYAEFCRRAGIAAE
jgi:hypothetical protein